MRYFVAFLILSFYYLSTGKAHRLQKLERQDWISITGFGFLFILLTQGLAILALHRLPAVTLSMVVNFGVLLTALFGVSFLKEKLNVFQWVGIAIFLLGVLIFFTPLAVNQANSLGLIIAALVMLFNVFSSILVRFINRAKRVDPLTVTGISMGAGSSLLLAAGLALEPLPSLKLSQIALILWMAFVNTAFAFVIWNRAMQLLQAAEWAVINNTMLIQIALLAWIFLGEAPSARAWTGMLISMLGITLVTAAAHKRGRWERA
jgi:drug/metabolite transporter (DMT)-like permease